MSVHKHLRLMSTHKNVSIISTHSDTRNISVTYFRLISTTYGCLSLHETDIVFFPYIKMTESLLHESKFILSFKCENMNNLGITETTESNTKIRLEGVLADGGNIYKVAGMSPSRTTSPSWTERDSRRMKEATKIADKTTKTPAKIKTKANQNQPHHPNLPKVTPTAGSLQQSCSVKCPDVLSEDAVAQEGMSIVSATSLSYVITSQDRRQKETKSEGNHNPARKEEERRRRGNDTEKGWMGGWGREGETDLLNSVQRARPFTLFKVGTTLLFLKDYIQVSFLWASSRELEL